MSLYTNLGGLELAALLQTALAAGKLRLTKSLVVISKTTPVATLIAAEADFSGYAAETLTTWLPPYVEGDAVSMLSPAVQFDLDGTASPIVPNTVYNWWVELAAGDLIVAGTFASPIPMVSGGDAIPAQVKLSWFATDPIVMLVGGEAA